MTHAQTEIAEVYADAPADHGASGTVEFSGGLTAEQERQLLGCYAVLHQLAATCEVPSVRAATRSAVAQLHAALDGEALEFEYYSHRWA